MGCVVEGEGDYGGTDVHTWEITMGCKETGETKDTAYMANLSAGARLLIGCNRASNRFEVTTSG